MKKVKTMVKLLKLIPDEWDDILIKAEEWEEDLKEFRLFLEDQRDKGEEQIHHYYHKLTWDRERVADSLKRTPFYKKLSSIITDLKEFFTFPEEDISQEHRLLKQLVREEENSGELERIFRELYKGFQNLPKEGAADEELLRKSREYFKPRTERALELILGSKYEEEDNDLTERILNILKDKENLTLSDYFTEKMELIRQEIFCDSQEQVDTILKEYLPLLEEALGEEEVSIIHSLADQVRLIADTLKEMDTQPLIHNIFKEVKSKVNFIGLRGTDLDGFLQKAREIHTVSDNEHMRGKVAGLKEHLDRIADMLDCLELKGYDLQSRVSKGREIYGSFLSIPDNDSMETPYDLILFFIDQFVAFTALRNEGSSEVVLQQLMKVKRVIEYLKKSSPQESSTYLKKQWEETVLPGLDIPLQEKAESLLSGKFLQHLKEELLRCLDSETLQKEFLRKKEVFIRLIHRDPIPSLAEVLDSLFELVAELWFILLAKGRDCALCLVHTFFQLAVLLPEAARLLEFPRGVLSDRAFMFMTQGRKINPVCLFLALPSETVNEVFTVLEEELL